MIEYDFWIVYSCILCPLIFLLLFSISTNLARKTDRADCRKMRDNHYILHYKRTVYIFYIDYGIVLVLLTLTPYFYGTQRITPYVICFIIFGLPGIACIIFFVWCAKWKIEIRENTIRFYRLLHKFEEFDLSDIYTVKKYVAFSNWSGRFSEHYAVYLGNSLPLRRRVFTITDVVLCHELFESHLSRSGINVKTG